MKHISAREMVELYYGDAAVRERATRHLEGCPECRSELAALRAALNQVELRPVPEPGPDFESRVWNRLEPLLPVRAPRRPLLFRLRPPVWAGLAVAACLVVGAFFAGQWVEHRGRGAATARVPESPVQRLLVVAVGDHLERSQMVLAEIAHAVPGQGKVDISEERQWAQDLLGENRLYRQTAQRAGDTGVANLLDDLERLLVEIANSPDRLPAGDWKAIRSRIENEGILFKVRVVGSRLQAAPSKQPEWKQTL
jgi:anti-sigma factor RsiW